MLGRLLDVGERQFTIFVRNIGRLIETSDRVSNVTGVSHRFFALFWVCEDAGW